MGGSFVHIHFIEPDAAPKLTFSDASTASSTFDPGDLEFLLIFTKWSRHLATSGC